MLVRPSRDDPESVRGHGAGERRRQAAADALDDTRSWVDPNGYQLSDRLWNAKQADRAAIDAILREGIATGDDPLNVARRLAEYLTPAGWRASTFAPPILRGTPKEYPSGLGNYAARRLARTEVTRALGQATMQAAERNPFVDFIRWNLSSGHPKPDECDRNASRDAGHGRGVYRKNDVPRYPQHPQCLCFLTQIVTNDIDAIVEQLRRDAGLAP